MSEKPKRTCGECVHYNSSWRACLFSVPPWAQYAAKMSSAEWTQRIIDCRVCSPSHPQAERCVCFVRLHDSKCLG
jgi:hypothetical protein